MNTPLPVKQSLRDILHAANNIEEKICAAGGELSEDDYLQLLNVKELLVTKADKIKGVMDHFKHKAEFWKSEAKVMNQIGSSLEDLADRLRGAVTQAMIDFNTEEILGDNVRITLKDTVGKLIIDDEKLIPAAYTTIHVSTNNYQIKKDLQSKIPIPGAHIEPGKTIQITRKRE